MQKWLPAILGFLITFGLVFLVLLGYSSNQPTLWLPFLLSAALGVILSSAPRLTGFWVRTLSYSLFFSGSSYLWIASGEANLNKALEVYRQTFHQGLAGSAIFDFVCLLAVTASTPIKARPKILPLLILFALGWLISYFSSGKGGADPMVQWFMHTFGYPHAVAESIVVGVRKTIHLSFYCTVAVVATWTMLSNGARREIAFRCGALMALSFASFDELRQSTIPTRQGSFWDVLLDMVGATAGLLLLAKLTTPKKRSTKPVRPKRKT